MIKFLTAILIFNFLSAEIVESTNFSDAVTTVAIAEQSIKQNKAETPAAQEKFGDPVVIDNHVKYVSMADNKPIKNKNANLYTFRSRCCEEKRFLIEFKPAYFLYQDKVFRDIFDNGGFLAIFGFDARAYKNLHVWLDLGYLHDKGTVESVDASTYITFLPISIGLKYQYQIRAFGIYAKLGPNWFYLSSKNDYPYVDKKVNKNGFGFTTGVGSLIDIAKNISIDLFVDYLYCHKKFTDPNSNLTIRVYSGGMAIGLGLAYRF